MKTIDARVAHDLRRRIVEGELEAGMRLPNRELLKDSYGISMATLQVAINRLIAEGFLEVKARKLGTWVAVAPPHRHHYKLVFPGGADLRDGLWRALHDCAEEIDADESSDRTFSFFYGLDGRRNLEAYEEVVREVQADRVAGLIFASSADELKGTPLLEHPNLPRAALAERHQLPGVPKVNGDLGSFFGRALGCLLERGCRRPAVIATSTYLQPFIQAAFASHGLAATPLRTHFVEAKSLAVANLANLLMSHPSERPDGIILSATQLVPGLLDALGETNLPIVAATNFPSDCPPPGIIRLGFHVPTLLDQLMGHIDAQRAGKTPAQYAALPALFEDELPATLP